MLRLRQTLLAVGALAVLVGAGRMLAEEKAKAASGTDHLDRLASKLKLDDKQKAEIGKIQSAYDAQADRFEHNFWMQLRAEMEDMKKVLNDTQRAQLPEITKSFRDKEMQKFAQQLQLTDAQKSKIATVCETYEPKFHALAGQTGQGDALPAQFRDLRSQMVAAIRAELNDDQREKLPLVLREEHRFWRNADVRCEHIKAACEKLGVTAAQKDQISKIQDEYEPKIKIDRTEMKKLHQEETAAIEKVLNEEQRAKWTELRKNRLGSENTGSKQ